MEDLRKACIAAFPHTIPILTGFLFLGMAFGILMDVKGFGIEWTMLLSLCTFAGSMQFVAVTLLTAAFQPWYAFVLTLMVNARHVFYSISMLDKFRNTGKYKPFLIFSLCDETFSVLCSSEPPKNVNRNMFMFCISFLNYSYWAIGSLLGALLGDIISFNTEGLDFVLTALFVVIFINQWKTLQHHIVPCIGVGCSILSLLIFGREQFIIPAMIMILCLLTWMRLKKKSEELL